MGEVGSKFFVKYLNFYKFLKFFFKLYLVSSKLYMCFSYILF